MQFGIVYIDTNLSPTQRTAVFGHDPPINLGLMKAVSTFQSLAAIAAAELLETNRTLL
jgi:hypothetical protein